MQRYVILRHDHPELHWDLMLENKGVLQTWRLNQLPLIDPVSDQTSIDLPAEAIPDHRIEYLDYEGPVSGARGDVKQWDRGTFSLLERKSDLIVALVTGEELAGQVTLKKTDQDRLWNLNYITFM